MNKNSCGCDEETLARMADYYNECFRKSSEHLIDNCILFHSKPSYSNFLKVKLQFEEMAAHMMRRDVFDCHRDNPSDYRHHHKE